MTQEWRIWTSASTPLFILLLLSTFLCMGGVACVCLSLATVYLLLFVWFVAFHVVFFSLFSFIVSFFLLLLLCSSKEKEEEKGKQDE